MATDATEPAPKKKGKLLIIMMAAVVLLGGAGAGAWFFLRAPAGTGDEAHADGDGPRTQSRRAAGAAPVFVSIDPFLFNLRDTGQDRFAQIAIVLEVEEASVENDLKSVAPAVRNALLMLMSSKTSDELLSVRGKQELSAQVVEAANAIIAGGRPPPIEPEASRSVSSDRDREINGGRERSDSDQAGGHQRAGADRHDNGTDVSGRDRYDDRRDRDDRDDRRERDGRRERDERRHSYPERVIAAHFAQFIVQ